MAKEIYQWDLTEEEAKDLEYHINLRKGNGKLLEALQIQLAEQQNQLNAWWESVTITHGIPKKYLDDRSLIANYELGKIWVKDKVKEFKEREGK